MVGGHLYLHMSLFLSFGCVLEMSESKPLFRSLLMLFHRKVVALVWRVRCKYYSLLLSAEKLRVNGRIKLICPENITLGRSVSINDGCIINAGGKVYIGDRTHVSPGCIINSGELTLRGESLEDRPHEYSSVFIEHDVWLASGVIVNPGVRIGAGSVVAAGAVVTKDIPAGYLAMGVPARPIRKF